MGQVGGYHRCGDFLLSWGLKTLHFLGHLFLIFYYLYLSGYHFCFLSLIIDFLVCFLFWGFLIYLTLLVHIFHHWGKRKRETKQLLLSTGGLIEFAAFLLSSVR